MRLIDAEALFEALHGIGGCGAEKESWAAGWDDAITEAIKLVSRAPTVDAESVVRHEHWSKENTREKSYLFKCSNCNKMAYYCGGNGICAYNWCPNCGAKMDAEEENE